MKTFWQYIKNPQEDCPYDYNIRTILLSTFLCLVIPLLCKFLTATSFVLMGIDLPLIASNKSALPLWFLLVIPPILEELGFRLPLKRNQWTIPISLAIITFVCSKLIFTGGLYTEHLIERILFAITTSMITNILLRKWLRKIKFKNFFYALTFSFAFLHIINYYQQPLTSVQWLYVTCYACAKVPGSFLYGYVRMKHGILFCIMIHIINNLPLLI